MSNVTKIWNFNDPKQAREFLESFEVRNENKMLKVSFVTLESGIDLHFKDMSDEQVQHYAAELARLTGIKQL